MIKSISNNVNPEEDKPESSNSHPLNDDTSNKYVRPKEKPPLLKNTTTNITETLIRSSEGHESYFGTNTLMTPATPRIELSRASSSSHHEDDSRESSPDNVFEQVGCGTLQDSLDFGFREEGAAELRNSTLELYFMDPVENTKNDSKRQEEKEFNQNYQKLPEKLNKATTSQTRKQEEKEQFFLQNHQRKDSACSEVAAFLCISGRSSRISSVGSQGSEVSRLSAVSGISRSPSPHRMILETSFCGPKPINGAQSSYVPLAVEAPTTEILEQTLLSRKTDPTSVVLAEGIQLTNIPKKKPTSLSNINTQKLEKLLKAQDGMGPANKKTNAKNNTQRLNTRSPGQMVIGKTQSGTEYIRINLKPDHFYEDQGIASHEKIVEAPNTISPVYAHSQKKPGTLNLVKNIEEEKKLSSVASPKASKHTPLQKQRRSRSPSPATGSVSRKSSFSSLFRLGGKDSPDSQHDRSRSKSKLKEETSNQSQNVTPSKQKTVLGIFRPGKKDSSVGLDSKSLNNSSPNESQQANDSTKQFIPNSNAQLGSRPNSRLKYYEDPINGAIHIPLHTPPEEKEAKQLLEDIQKLTADVRNKPIPAPITPGQLVAAAANLRPIASRQASNSHSTVSTVAEKKNNTKKIIENLDTIHVVSQDYDTKEQAPSNKLHKLRSNQFQGSQTCESDSVKVEYCEAEIYRLPSVEDISKAKEPKVFKTLAAINQTNYSAIAIDAKEKRKFMFATRLGSGSDEQIFATQFSLSKTASQSSQLSEQHTDHDFDNDNESKRTETIIERTEAKKAIDSTIEGKEDKRLLGLSTVEDEKLSHGNSSEKHQQHKCPSDKDSPETPMQRPSTYFQNNITTDNYEASINQRESLTTNQDENAENILNLTQTQLSEPSSMKVTATVDKFVNMPDKREAPTTITNLQTQIEKVPRVTPIKPPRASPPIKASSSTSNKTAERSSDCSSKSPVSRKESLQHKSDRQSINSMDDPAETSESEKESGQEEVREVSSTADPKKHLFPHHIGQIEDHESTGLVSQESFDDDFPYIPASVPQEKSQGVSIIPMKERAHMEVKTCPVERPRSTTPFHPSQLEEYCGITSSTSDQSDFSNIVQEKSEKLRISLPKKCSSKETPTSSKSPRKLTPHNTKAWFEFAEEALRAPTNLVRKDSDKQHNLPQTMKKDTTNNPKSKKKPSNSSNSLALQQQPKADAEIPIQTHQSIQRKLSGHWIDFESIPEKRKPPKRITALPTSGPTFLRHHATEHSEARTSKQTDIFTSTSHCQREPVERSSTDLIYNFVKPEECQCECHEGARSSTLSSTDFSTNNAKVQILQKGEDMLPLLNSDLQEQIDPNESSHKASYGTDPDTSEPSSAGPKKSRER